MADKEITDLSGYAASTLLGQNPGNTDLIMFPIFNALTETVAGKVLDARQGKALKDLIDAHTASLDTKVDENSAVTGATKTKITYDAKGLVTAGADATTADFADSSNKRFVTDAQLVVIGNTSGTNTGNETAATLGATLAGSAAATPNDTDLVATAESGVVKKITWTNVKAFLKTYFDVLYESLANKDATGGYAGLTLFRINFKNAANTFTSFFTNSNTAARTYTFQDRNGTISDDTDLAVKLNHTGGTLTNGIFAGTQVGAKVEIQVACSDETTAITTGTAKVTFRMPYAMTLTAVRASATTAPTGSTILIDINESGTTVLSTKLMIDASEKTSTTAATPYVISDSALADDSEITIDFDQVGSSVAGAGVKVTLIGTRA